MPIIAFNDVQAANFDNDQNYKESDFTITPSSGDYFYGITPGISFFGGSDAITQSSFDKFAKLTYDKSVPFSVVSIDLNELEQGQDSRGYTEHLIGTKSDGTTVSQSIDLNGSRSFKTYTLNGFSNLVSFAFDFGSTTRHIQVDNIVVSLTPPGSDHQLPPASIAPTSGPDALTGTLGKDVIVALAGDDTIDGLGGDDLILGNQGDDRITLGDGSNTVHGGRDDDTIVAGGGDNLLFGEQGSDSIATGDGSNTIVGGVDSTDGADAITTGTGRDLIFGNGGGDSVAAGGGKDTIVGGFGNDMLLGDEGDDIVLGNQGNDALFGGTGDDTLYGGRGDDTLTGGPGDDLMFGNQGSNRFVFDAGDTGFVSGVGTGDGVGDFKSDTDSLHFASGPAGTSLDFGTASTTSTNFGAIQALAQTMLSGGDTYAFVGDGVDGFLFTSAGGQAGSITDALKLTGVKKLQFSDLK